MSVLVLSKHKLENTVQFIDASELCTKHSHGNILESEHIAQILQAFDARSDVLGLSKVVSADEISANNYNLLVGSYVEPAPVVCDDSSFKM
jgi:type I restriction enzyme M protein